MLYKKTKNFLMLSLQNAVISVTLNYKRCFRLHGACRGRILIVAMMTALQKETSVARRRLMLLGAGARTRTAKLANVTPTTTPE